MEALLQSIRQTAAVNLVQQPEYGSGGHGGGPAISSCERKSAKHRHTSSRIGNRNGCVEASGRGSSKGGGEAGGRPTEHGEGHPAEDGLPASQVHRQRPVQVAQRGARCAQGSRHATWHKGHRCSLGKGHGRQDALGRDGLCLPRAPGDVVRVLPRLEHDGRLSPGAVCRATAAGDLSAGSAGSQASYALGAPGVLLEH
ncbi:hypothetical protein BC831DRAFT_461959 [Entophlyctis helioformis]|nr:hypothetical protein BC831DRAFT_461959 [Entophlyctis helioformis]